jgi:predicted ATPase
MFIRFWQRLFLWREAIMKLIIKNFGVIDTADINTHEGLTFIYGKNNIGKSYTIIILYLILKKFIYFRRNFVYRISAFIANSGTFLNIFNKVFESIEKLSPNSDGIDITTETTEYFSKIIKRFFLLDFEDSLQKSFGDISSLSNKISNDNFEICIEFEECNIKITNENKDGLFVKYDSKKGKYECRKAENDRMPDTIDRRTVLYFTEKNNFMRDIGNCFYNEFMENIYKELSKINNVYFLPSSRSGLFRGLRSFGPTMVALSQKRNILRNYGINIGIEPPTISEQDSDYFNQVISVNTQEIKYFNSIAEEMEKNILKGKVSFDRTITDILFQPDDTKLRLNSLGVSSMVAEISPIVLFLRHIIDFKRNAKPIIFIEEPEVHLHPEVQILLMKYFVKLANMGARLIITSHSDYMFHKLNNSIISKEIGKEKIVGIIFRFDKDKKGSYSEKIQVSDTGMEDNNFVHSVEELYNERNEILGERNRSDD